MTPVDDAPLRPALHLTPSAGWINDPLGVTHRADGYHVFYQYVPGATTWAPECRWGHAVSQDLITWKELPVAIGPGEGDDGAWSGAVYGEGPDARMFYTSVTLPDIRAGAIRVAEPSDGAWLTWHKRPGAVALAPDALPVTSFRDPFITRDHGTDRWRMLVGASLEHDPEDPGSPGPVAAVLGYVSDDLDTWTFDRIVASRPSSVEDPVWTGSLWECPQVLSVDGREVLLVSVWHQDQLNYVAYREGRWDGGEFLVAGPWQRLTYGTLYAATSFHDAHGRPCLMQWIRGMESHGRAGALTVPHLLTWRDGRLRVQCHPAVADAVAPRAVHGAERVETEPALLRMHGRDVSVTASTWSVERVGEIVTVSWPGGAEALLVDDDPVDVLVDYGCLEVFGGHGVLGVALH